MGRYERDAASRTATLIALLVCLPACGNQVPARSEYVSLAGQPPSTLVKIATWNIRSGMGATGFRTTTWDSETLNCTDPSKPMNAWGIGLPQAELRKIRNDTAIVALGIQEGWNCGSPANVNSVLGFKGVSRERDGTALLARHGFSSPVQFHQLNALVWLVSGDVCLDAACTASLPVVAAHWGYDSPQSLAQRTLAFMSTRPVPNVLMGDLNVYRIDPWSPIGRCAAHRPAFVTAIALLESAGYVDAWKATQSSEGWTGMASRAGCGMPNGNLYKRIDYVYTKGVPVLSTTRFGRTAPGSDSPSDHVGLIAELSVPISPRNATAPALTTSSRTR